VNRIAGVAHAGRNAKAQTCADGLPFYTTALFCCAIFENNQAGSAKPLSSFDNLE